LHQVYLTLMALAAKHVLRFVPQKRTPFVRYRQRREDSKDLFISHEIYEDLRDRFAQRIEAMLSYVTTDNQCRSRQLLHYFGEDDTHDCGQCDVCLQDKRPADVRGEIIRRLSDKKQHALSELRDAGLAHDEVLAALERLVTEGVVIDDDGLLSLS
jgi:ATP-dependent DNA helicase RecQ